MAPLVRRSLAPAGCTPIITHKASHREKVSLMSALCLSPALRRIALRFRTYPKQYVTGERTADFLRGLLEQLPGRVLVVWDNVAMHRGPPIRALLATTRRLELRSLPPYAPELNPVEQVWQHLKWTGLANFAPRDVEHLHQVALERLGRIRRTPSRLQSFLRCSDLPFD